MSVASSISGFSVTGSRRTTSRRYTPGLIPMLPSSSGLTTIALLGTIGMAVVVRILPDGLIVLPDVRHRTTSSGDTL